MLAADTGAQGLGAGCARSTKRVGHAVALDAFSEEDYISAWIFI